MFVVSGEPLVKEDEVFAAECEALLGILEERAGLYEEEEHALRVMIQEEVQERMLAGGGGEGDERKNREHCRLKQVRFSSYSTTVCLVGV